MEMWVVEMYGMMTNHEYFRRKLLSVEGTTVGHGFADYHTDHREWR